MTFDEINYILTDTISIEENFYKIEHFFYSMSDTQIKEFDHKIEDLYSEIKTSICHLENETLKISILLLFAKFFEKTANRGLIIDVIKLVPDTLSIKHRLNAFIKYTGFKDISCDFTKRCADMLLIFSRAIDLEEDEHTEEVIDSIIQYLDFAEKTLSIRFPSEFDRLKEILLSIENSSVYPFLEHGKLLGRLTGREIFDLSVLNYSNTIYSPSNTIDNFFNEKIILPIKIDSRTQWHQKPMGYDSSKIRRDILLYGRGDFNEPYEDISCDEKVLLYCYFNLRKHYFSSFSFFERVIDLEKYFAINNSCPLFLDFGCGPATSLLALVDYIAKKNSSKVTLRYIGFDISESMLRKANDFSCYELIDEKSDIKFLKTWTNSEDIIRNMLIDSNILIINACYLFASSSLNEVFLAEYINTIVTHKPNGLPVYLLFQNPNDSDKNQKYDSFKRLLINFKSIDSGIDKIFYRTNSSTTFEPTSEVVKFEFLKHI